MAKKTWITNWYPRDEHVFNAFATCGALQKEDMNEYVKDKRIKNYERDGYIEKCTDTRTGDEYYKLTEKGKDLCRDQYDREPTRFYSWNHEKGNRDMYFMMSKSQRMEQMSEPELRRTITNYFEELKQSNCEEERERGHKMQADYKAGRISCPDFGVLKINEQSREVERAEFCETITASYKPEEVDAKFGMSQAFGGTLTPNYV